MILVLNFEVRDLWLLLQIWGFEKGSAEGSSCRDLRLRGGERRNDKDEENGCLLPLCEVYVRK